MTLRIIAFILALVFASPSAMAESDFHKWVRTIPGAEKCLDEKHTCGPVKTSVKYAPWPDQPDRWEVDGIWGSVWRKDKDLFFDSPDGKKYHCYVELAWGKVLCCLFLPQNMF